MEQKSKMLLDIEHDNITLSLTSIPGTQPGGPEEASRQAGEGKSPQGEPGEEGRVLQGRHQGGKCDQRPKSWGCSKESCQRKFESYLLV